MRIFGQYQNIIDHIEIGEGILETVPAWLNAKNYKNILLVSDINTHKAAGARIAGLLSGAGIPFDEYIFNDDEVMPDEASVAALEAAIPDNCGLLLGVGSGTINDLCKYAGHRVSIPSAIIATAPSMDGYTAKGAAMVIAGMKVTPQTQCPVAVFCDIDVMRAAPERMLASGLGDILGKYSALADWKLSHILTGEPMPADLTDVVEKAVRLCANSAHGLAKRDPEAVLRLTEGLLLSGIAMSVYGDSRPASGTEHHLSHYWEMRFLAERKKPASHGFTVGIGTLIALRLWQSLPVLPKRPMPEDRERTLALVSEKYGPSAPALLPVPNPNLDFNFIMEKWPEIQKIARENPEPAYIEGLLRLAGAPVMPSEADIDGALLKESILLARERKKVYTVLQLMGDLGLLD
ncbi:MAG: sn-glycerol-1-phosphate dehydrogenase [Clostridiales bacterium]|jgi:glycerol-1-phosphate dehydrogenase [NAD(P)+]|nr:sn-glycerol-1-phosphate dehydrogenase [Clostridiales bacterium]